MSLCVDCGARCATFNYKGKVHERNRCPDCHCTFNKNRRLEKEMAKDPDKYVQCDECCQIQLKRDKRGTRRVCKSCDSLLNTNT